MSLEWMRYARTKIGQHEVLGDKDNPYIVSCLAKVGITKAHDETPWCSAFVNDCLLSTGYKATRKANARSWIDYDRSGRPPYPSLLPVFGCVVIYSRPPDPSHGHVNFFLWELDDEICGLGGNQGNEVSIAFYPKSRVLGYRWPVK
jgi:uncharacterized protein (TIGR02594 family)